MWRVILVVVVLSFVACVVGCATTRGRAPVSDGVSDDYYKNHGVIWRIFHPRVMAGRPWWQKALYWVGPGHCPFCRGVLNMTTDFDDWPSPYRDLSGKSESAKAPQK
jgi:hypothetical protein